MNIIAGGGKYGCEAVEYLRSKKDGFVLVDKDPGCLAIKKYALKTGLNFDRNSECFIQGDMSTVLSLIQELDLDYLFPTAPIHIVAELAKLKFKLKPWPEAINIVLSRIPPSIILKSGRGQLIVSYNRDENCIDKCGVPTICPSTKRKKPRGFRANRLRAAPVISARVGSIESASRA